MCEMCSDHVGIKHYGDFMQHKFLPLFTGGSGRSGTTIILGMLRHHPQIHSSLPREIKYLTSQYGLLDLNFGRPLYLEEDLKSKVKNIKGRISHRFGSKNVNTFLIYLNTKWWSGIGKKGKPRGLIQGITKNQLSEAINNFKIGFSADKQAASRAFFMRPLRLK